MELCLNALQLSVVDVDLFPQLAKFRLDLNAWPGPLQASLQFIDFVVELSLLSLINVSRGGLVLSLLDDVQQMFQWIVLDVVGFSEFIVAFL
jgi:hypothetical protein